MLNSVVLSHASLPVAELPGIKHRTIAGQEHGPSSLSIWQQSLEPGAATPPHIHETEEVVICQAGHGEVHIHGRMHDFGPNTSLLLPANVPHRIFNVGEETMQIMGVLPSAPVVVFDLDRNPLELPW